MSDKISRRDFLKLSTKVSLATGLATRLSRLKITDVSAKPDTPTSQLSEILVDWSKSTSGNENTMNLFAVDTLTSVVQNSFTYDSGKISPKVISNIEKVTHQQIKTFNVEWIAEYDKPVVHATTRPNIESAIIRTDSETDMFGQTEQKVFFVFSSGPGNLKIIDITTLNDKGVPILHKGGIITRDVIDWDKNIEYQEVYKIEGGDFKLVKSNIMRHIGGVFNENVAFDGNIPSETVFTTKDNQIAILKRFRDKNTQLILLSSKADQIVELRDYDPKLIFAKSPTNNVNDIFILGKYVSYLTLQNIPDNKLGHLLVFRLQNENMDFGETLNISANGFRNLQKVGYLIDYEIDNLLEFNQEGKQLISVRARHYKDASGQTFEIFNVKISNGTILINENKPIVEEINKRLNDESSREKNLENDI